MISLLVSVYSAVCSSFRTRAALQLEILALRHQINVLRRVTARACTPAPRGPVPLDLAFALLAKLALGPGHRQTGNVIAWHSPGIPALLDLEEPSRTNRQAGISKGDPRAPSHAEEPCYVV